MEGELPKHCKCCGAIYRTRAEWDTLPLCGRQDDFAPDILEHRHCVGVKDGAPCRTTLCIALTADEPVRRSA